MKKNMGILLDSKNICNDEIVSLKSFWFVSQSEKKN
jgi:hypothetical protein